MSQFKLGESVFADKVLGCWMGKNCGGTLGAPLEKGYGEEEPYDVWWYPELREGGIPNDDLEMQLIWLKALEEVGPNLKAADLAQYWLDHIGYNWDEYGLSKTNLRLGLLPPVSGYFNNWFKHSMGCPIRSEIWACVAPGAPRIAVRLAYEDAICDHAGGESVYGEMFNTAIESAAFVVSDMETLLDIGRSYVADGSETARAVDAARAAYREGVDWRIARRRVMDATLQCAIFSHQHGLSSNWSIVWQRLRRRNLHSRQLRLRHRLHRRDCRQHSWNPLRRLWTAGKMDRAARFGYRN